MSRKNSHMDWVQKCIVEYQLNPGDLCMSQYYPHNDYPTPNSAFVFQFSLVFIKGT